MKVKFFKVTEKNDDGINNFLKDHEFKALRDVKYGFQFHLDKNGVEHAIHGVMMIYD